MEDAAQAAALRFQVTMYVWQRAREFYQRVSANLGWTEMWDDLPLNRKHRYFDIAYVQVMTDKELLQDARGE